MDDKKNYEIFNGKTLSGLFNDIYKNSDTTGKQVENLIIQLKKFVTSLESATVIVPLIREYLDVKVKSDEHLVKLSDTVQRLLRSDKTTGEEGLLITEDEKKRLLEDVPTYEEIRRKEELRIKNLDKQVEIIKEELTEKMKEENTEDGV